MVKEVSDMMAYSFVFSRGRSSNNVYLCLLQDTRAKIWEANVELIKTHNAVILA